MPEGEGLALERPSWMWLSLLIVSNVGDSECSLSPAYIHVRCYRCTISTSGFDTQILGDKLEHWQDDISIQKSQSHIDKAV